MVGHAERTVGTAVGVSHVSEWLWLVSLRLSLAPQPGQHAPSPHHNISLQACTFSDALYACLAFHSHVKLWLTLK